MQMMQQEKSEVRHPASEIVTRVVDSHTRIRADLEVLASSADLDEIRAVVDDLPDLLKEHFRDEEKPGGLFDELRSLRPVFDSQLKYLRGEHREIMRTLEGLQHEIQEMDELFKVGDREQRLDHIRMSAASFLQLIQHHERIESRLVGETYYSEDGGSG
jgi:hemerythrin-like domain-containing protein